MEDPARDRPQDQAAAHADGRHRQRVLQHQVGAAFLLPGPAVARRSARRACHRGGRAQRPELARGRRAKPASMPTSSSSATAANDPMLPWDIIDGGMKASFFRREFEKSTREEWTLPPEAAAGERAPAADGLSRARRRSASASPASLATHDSLATALRRDRRPLFVFLERLEHQIADRCSAPSSRRSGAAARSCGVRR